jgi:hypothetical protein
MKFRYPNRPRPWLDGYTPEQIEVMPFKEFWRLRNKWYYYNVVKVKEQAARTTIGSQIPNRAPMDIRTFPRTVRTARRSNFVGLQRFPVDRFAEAINEMLR